jgi:hypothetical protein
MLGRRTATTVVGVEAARTDCLLRSTEIMNGSVETHIRLHIHALLELHHDAVDAGLEILPCRERVVLVRHGRHNGRHGGREKGARSTRRRNVRSGKFGVGESKAQACSGVGFVGGDSQGLRQRCRPRHGEASAVGFEAAFVQQLEPEEECCNHRRQITDCQVACLRLQSASGQNRREGKRVVEAVAWGLGLAGGLDHI